MPTTAPASVTAVHRIEVRAKPNMPDPIGEQAMHDARSRGLDPLPTHIDGAMVYLIAGSLDDARIQRIADELLTDPVTQYAVVGVSPQPDASTVEVHPLPGVMDPDAAPIALAVDAMLGIDVQVTTGRRYDMQGIDQRHAVELAERCLANRVIQQITTEPYHPTTLPAGEPHELRVIDVPIRDMTEQELLTFSREAHLFLSLGEMRAIQDEYKRLGREPREIELETLAQTWSEHCVHKTLKSKVTYRDSSDAMLPNLDARPGHTYNADGSIHIDNLLKSTVAAATHELMHDGVDWCLSVFVDNAGVVAFDDEHAVCFKVETHNHPSAIEPYGGAATGIGGCIRDIIGTGLAAKPIANTDVFCVAHPTSFHDDLPAGCLHPRRILTQVVAGVRDYGNRMGIPTVNGAVWFDDRYVGNPLVYCGCVGVMPRNMVTGDPQCGDHIIALGGRTGRDGIHGATFSSAELTDTHADEFSHAVQIGNPVEEKKVLDAILDARDHQAGCLYRAITDCGAGGFSSAVGEMGEKLGATVQLDRAPLKYDGLTATEIWISEAQERMVLAVPAENIQSLAALCATHNVEMCDLGTFGTDSRELILRYNDTEVGRLSMDFMHNGVPDTTREAVWDPAEHVSFSPAGRGSKSSERPATSDALLQLLAHPNIASKHWIIRQYDHEVQGATMVKPLVGAQGIGPSDAAVMTPVAGSTRGIAIANGLATNLASDPYVMTLAAIDECVRNLVCVGADPDRIAILDNFCWPGCDDPHVMGGLVRAAEACYDGAKAYRTPFISGKDSLNNQFTTESGETIRIPPTMLISGMGIVHDVTQCVTMDAKRAGNLLALLGPTQPWLCGSHYQSLFGGGEDDPIRPHVDLDFGPKAARCVHALIRAGLAKSAHDGSDGGLLVGAAEMCIAGGLGVDLAGLAAYITANPDLNIARACFGECASAYFLEIAESDIADVERIIRDCGLGADAFAPIGTFIAEPRMRAGDLLDVSVDELRTAWRAPLDW